MNVHAPGEYAHAEELPAEELASGPALVGMWAGHPSGVAGCPECGCRWASRAG